MSGWQPGSIESWGGHRVSNSLQDQLLKAGLVSQSQLNKAKKGKSKKARQRDVVKKEAKEKL